MQMKVSFFRCFSKHFFALNLVWYTHSSYLDFDADMCCNYFLHSGQEYLFWISSKMIVTYNMLCFVFDFLVVATGSRKKPETCFLYEQLRWKLLSKECCNTSVFGCGGNTQSSSWELWVNQAQHPIKKPQPPNSDVHKVPVTYKQQKRQNAIDKKKTDESDGDKYKSEKHSFFIFLFFLFFQFFFWNFYLFFLWQQPTGEAK